MYNRVYLDFSKTSPISGNSCTTEFWDCWNTSLIQQYSKTAKRRPEYQVTVCYDYWKSFSVSDNNLSIALYVLV